MGSYSHISGIHAHQEDSVCCDSSIQNKVSRNQSTLWTKLDNKLVLLDIELGRYYEANALGSLIWEMIEEPRTVAGIVEQIVSRYRVDHEQGRSDVLKYLGDLSAAGLIVMDESAHELEDNAKSHSK
jgi:hypothetical protein